MPRYLFDIKREGRSPDIVAVELADAATARLEAARMMGEDLKRDPAAFWDDEEWQIVVSDETGLILFTVTCSSIRAPALLH